MLQALVRTHCGLTRRRFPESRTGTDTVRTCSDCPGTPPTWRTPGTWTVPETRPVVEPTTRHDALCAQTHGGPVGPVRSTLPCTPQRERLINRSPKLPPIPGFAADLLENA